MWDLIVSVPDHCLSFYFLYENDFKVFGGNILLKGNVSEVDIVKHFNNKTC